jgi:hypothetical protein
MPIEHILALLVEERDKLNRAIEALGGIVKKGRGRFPKNNPLGTAVSTLAPPAVHAKPRKKRRFTAAQRKEQAARMRAYWAAKKKTKK